MNRVLRMYHGELFRFWYGKNATLCYYHGTKYNQIQSLPAVPFDSGINFRNYKQDAIVVMQSVSIVVSFVGLMLACVAQFG